MKTNPLVDNYLAAGCGRCELVNTPRCKVNPWRGALERLRAIVLAAGLREELKWSHPCYTLENGENVAMLGAFKDNCVLSFLKGALLTDPRGILEKPGENTQSARVLRIRDASEVDALEDVIKSYLAEAVELERSGAKAAFKPIDDHEVPAELAARLDADAPFREAWQKLTPGRRRGYLLEFARPKQSATRLARIERAAARIIAGKGPNDR